MVRRELSTSSCSIHRIELLANLSWTLDRLAAFFLVLSAVTLLVALWPTIMGFWPIMAIALVHLAIVGICFRLAWRGHWARQDISVEGEQVLIKHRSAKREQITRWPVSRVRVAVETNKEEPHVFLRLHDRQIELGKFLPAPERLEAAKVLSEMLAPFSIVRAHQTN